MRSATWNIGSPINGRNLVRYVADGTNRFAAGVATSTNNMQTMTNDSIFVYSVVKNGSWSEWINSANSWTSNPFLYYGDNWTNISVAISADNVNVLRGYISEIRILAAP
jgi:hypothetical protein